MSATNSAASAGMDENGLIPYGQQGYFEQPFIYCYPPPGITPNFNSPNPNGTLYIVISVIGLLLAALFTLMRLYTKFFLTLSPGWDDYTCALCLAGVFAWTGLTVKMASLGMGRHSWDDKSSIATQEFYLKPTLKITFYATNVYFFVICIVKVSILLLYLRTFKESRRFRISAYVAMFLLVCVHIITFPIYWFALSPVSCQWRVFTTDEDFEANCTKHMAAQTDNYWFSFLAAFTIVLDLVILIMPCPAVWRLHMAKRQKIVVIGILVSGIVVTVASSLRLGYIIHRLFLDELGDKLWTEFQVDLISTIEMVTAVICTCLPTLQAFMRRFFPSLLQLGTWSKPSFNRSTKRSKAAHSSSHHLIKSDRKWATESRDEQLTNAAYLELGADGKSDQSYGMMTIEVKTNIEISSVTPSATAPTALSAAY